MANTETTAQSERTATRATILEYEQQLKQYGVVINSTKPYPKELDNFIRNTVKAKRTGPHSPEAKELRAKAPAAQLMNERKAMEELAPHLGFLDANAEGGEKYNIMWPEAQFHMACVTNPNNSKFRLAQPKPDKTMGYMTHSLAEAWKKTVQPAFSEEEEQKLLLDPVIPLINRHVLCPWYTIQFKSFEAYAGLKLAKLQCGRDSPAVSEYLHRVFERAGIQPTPVDTMHWSMTCDTKTIELFVHWRVEDGNGRVQYHMRRVCDSELEAFDEDAEENIQVVKIRQRLRNLLDHAQGPRLARIKTALRSIPQPEERSGGKSPSKKASSNKQFDEAISFSVTSSAFAN